nr:isochorismate synthase, chloroplastic [Tanacetum cinerariifolium]
MNLSKIRDNKMIMISKMRQDQPKEKWLNLEEAKGKEPRNRCKLLGYKWIFKKKMKADGIIDKYKARLAIKGFRQQGLHYFDTYSTRITPVKMILAIVALRNWKVHQIDVKMIFLKGDLEKVLYMNQPVGFMAPRLESKDIYVNSKRTYQDGVNRVGGRDEEIGLVTMVRGCGRGEASVWWRHRGSVLIYVGGGMLLVHTTVCYGMVPVLGNLHVCRHRGSVLIYVGGGMLLVHTTVCYGMVPVLGSLVNGS